MKLDQKRDKYSLLKFDYQAKLKSYSIFNFRAKFSWMFQSFKVAKIE